VPGSIVHDDDASDLRGTHREIVQPETWNTPKPTRRARSRSRERSVGRAPCGQPAKSQTGAGVAALLVAGSRARCASCADELRKLAHESLDRAGSRPLRFEGKRGGELARRVPSVRGTRIMHTTRFPAAHALTWSTLALAVCPGCYDWQASQPPPSASDAEQGTGQGGAGTASASSASGDPSTTGAGAPSEDAAASSSAVGAATSSGSGVGGGGVQSCEGGGCDACIQCAIADACAAEADACAQDPDCASFADCIAQCAEASCISACADIDPDGASIFQDAASCVVCGACATDCSDLSPLVGCNQ